MFDEFSGRTVIDLGCGTVSVYRIIASRYQYFDCLLDHSSTYHVGGKRPAKTVSSSLVTAPST